MKHPVAYIYPPEFVQRPILAAEMHDEDEINRVTDELAQRGYVRPRSFDGRSERGPEALR